MARRRRTRPRPAAAAHAEGGTLDRDRRSGARRVTGSARATGAPSAALERAAAAERIYVLKDFRRMAVVCGIVLAMLAVSGVAVNALVR